MRQMNLSNRRAKRGAVFLLYGCLVFLLLAGGTCPGLAAGSGQEAFQCLKHGANEFFISPAKPRPGQALVVFCRPLRADALSFSQVLFAGRSFPLEKISGGRRGVVAIPLGTAPGLHELVFETAAGKRQRLTLEVVAHDYGEQHLTLPKKMVTPMRPETLARIKRDRKLLRRVYASSGKHLLFHGKITPPLRSRLTSTFGRRRLLNGKPKAPHGGIDYKAAVGVPVPAAGDGRVVLAGNLYYSGNIVIIDHGLDIFTLYMHLSKINCRVGDLVRRGQIIGKSGRSGRVTGPHLHWGVKIAGVFVDPLEFADLSSLLAEPPWNRKPDQGE